MSSHKRHARQARRSWCAGLAAVAVVTASLASASTASAAAPPASPVSSDCSGSVSAGLLVPFDTIAHSGAATGVQVGPMFCPVPDGQAVQVVVLNRSSLEEISNYGYSTDQFAELGSYLQGLDKNNELVIVTHPGNQPALPSDKLPQLNTSLNAIGGNLGALWLFSPNQCWSGSTNYCFGANGGEPAARWQQSGSFYGGSFTVIGIPGMPAGQAWRETAAQNQATDGPITGYLTHGTLSTGGSGQYTVVDGPDPYVPVNTNSCTDDGCGVRVGDTTYYGTPGVSNGFHVVVLDRTTLARISDQTVTTTDALWSAILNPNVYPVVGHSISYPGVTDQRLVIIQSVGDGHLTGSAADTYVAARDIDQLGGTPEYFMPSLTATATSGFRYALVGAATDLPWHATTSLESSTAMRYPGNTTIPGQPTGQIDGVVQRDRDGLYTPSAGDAVGPTNVALYPIIYQPAQAWPYADDTTDLKYVADNIGLSGAPDVRSAYTDTLLKSSWHAFRDDLTALTCPPTPPQSGACDPSSFGAVKAELRDEFIWVPEVYSLIDEIQKTYVQGNAAQGFNVDDVTKKVLDSIRKTSSVPGNATVTARWQQIFGSVMSTASFIASKTGQGAAAAVFGLLGASVTMANQTMQTPSGGSADDVTAAADNLAEQLGHQQLATYEWLNNLQDILLSDYGKLSAVGTAILGQEPGWVWMADTTTNSLIDALNGNARAAAYSALVPVAWPAYNLIPRITGKANPTDPNDVKNFSCSEYAKQTINGEPYFFTKTSQTFGAALPQNQFHANAFYVDGGTTSLGNQVWTLGAVSGFADNDYPTASMPPTEDLASDIYGSNATSSDGAFQYEASWWRSTYNPPSHVECVHTDDPNYGVSKPFSTAWAPPSITPPPP